MDGLSLGIRDAVYVLGIVATALGLWTRLRKSASDVAVWRREVEMRIEHLQENLTAHKTKHDSDAGHAAKFRADMRAFAAETRDRLTRIEALQNGGAR